MALSFGLRITLDQVLVAAGPPRNALISLNRPIKLALCNNRPFQRKYWVTQLWVYKSWLLTIFDVSLLLIWPWACLSGIWLWHLEALEINFEEIVFLRAMHLLCRNFFNWLNYI